MTDVNVEENPTPPQLATSMGVFASASALLLVLVAEDWAGGIALAMFAIKLSVFASGREVCHAA